MGKMALLNMGLGLAKKAKQANEFRHADKEGMARQAGHSAFTAGTDVGKEAGKTWLKTFETIPRFVCRGLQFILALVACGFYGNRVDADRKDDDGGFSPEWIFAIIVGGVSAVTAAVFIAVVPLGALPFLGSRLKFVKTYRAFALDFALFILWIVVFGIFAGIFLPRDGDDERYKGASTGAMKTAVWVDLVNAIFWLITGAYGAVKTFLGRKTNALTDKMGNKILERKQSGGSDTDIEMGHPGQV
ncbi:hypothetical protein ACRE_063060 [Hapsidospora chrysogenum ATCC 11550]|uniref:MARVEL domain-containing protein n=1 Tax=Hapsidospora chrysogenum (strain ATCC 11550 / CBS 779.69 / DSM 880 / IAM 14645 / JCM 23072 / IMI 49137) TaxID=857340 RepID=A0A086T0S3_HAPC1|nr:hypothetical protein ACRE_063060 [Hapsidospora chrysogenum ATCC 11550]